MLTRADRAGTSLAWTPSFWLGTVSWVLFLLLLVSGLPLMVYYVPSIAGAYASMKDIEHVVSFGSWLLAVHRLAAHLMVITVSLHLARVFLTGAYKNGAAAGPRREWNWAIGTAARGRAQAGCRHGGGTGRMVRPHRVPPLSPRGGARRAEPDADRPRPVHRRRGHRTAVSRPVDEFVRNPVGTMKAVFSRQFMLSAGEKEVAIAQLRAAYAEYQAQLAAGRNSLARAP